MFTRSVPFVSAESARVFARAVSLLAVLAVVATQPAASFGSVEAALPSSDTPAELGGGGGDRDAWLESPLRSPSAGPLAATGVSALEPIYLPLVQKAFEGPFPGPMPWTPICDPGFERGTLDPDVVLLGDGQPPPLPSGERSYPRADYRSATGPAAAVEGGELTSPTMMGEPLRPPALTGSRSRQTETQYAPLVDHSLASHILEIENPDAMVTAQWDSRTESIDAMEASFTRPLYNTGPLSFPLGWFGYGCDGMERPQDVAGKVALVERGECSFSEKVRNATAAGARGVVLFTNDSTVARMTGDWRDGDIPGVMIEREPGLELRDALEEGKQVDVTVDLVPLPADPDAAIEECVSQRMQELNIPGAVVVVAKDGEIVSDRAYGVKHAEEGGVVDGDTMFAIARLTDLLTSATLLKLVDEAKVDLDAPVTRYVPELAFASPWRADEITVHDVLSQSAGLSGMYQYDSEGGEDVLSEWASQSDWWVIMATPRSLFFDSTPSASLIGLIVERVEQQPYAEVVTNKLLRPAGMTNTTLDAAEALAKGNWAYGHDRGERTTIDVKDSPLSLPGTGGISTARDLVRFATMLMADGDGVLSEESAKAMQTPHIWSDEGLHVDMGYGMYIWYSSQVLQHGLVSYGDGYCSTIAWLPEHNAAYASLSNSEASAGTTYCSLAPVVRFGREWPPVDYASSPESWRGYEGSYAVANENGYEWTARVDRRGEMLELAESHSGPLLPKWQLTNSFTSTFTVEDPLTGWTDEVDFIDDRDMPGTTRWLRGEWFVGMRLGDFPEKVHVVGDSCSTLEFTPDMDIAALEFTAAGLRPIEELLDQPVEQDDTGSIESAAFKYPVQVPSPGARFVAQLDTEEDDWLLLYILYDENRDGSFDFADETVAWTTSELPTKAASTGGYLGAGNYEVWVHGWDVQGEDSTFDLRLDVVYGDDLTLNGAPTRADAGTQYSMDVCASGVTETSRKHYGMITLDFGYPYRRLRIPVEWTQDAPTATPTPTPTLEPTPTATRVPTEPPQLKCWDHGGELPQTVVDELDDASPAYAGQYSALLGDPALGDGSPGSAAIPVGSAWVEQTVPVPDSPTAELSFWYRMTTYDVAQDAARQVRDIFAVSIDGEIQFSDGNTEATTPGERHQIDWRRGSIDMSPWRGETVTIRLANWNGQYGGEGAEEYNTWTYLDDVYLVP